MTLFQRIFSRFADATRSTREGGAEVSRDDQGDMTRSAGTLASFLTGYDDEGGTRGLRDPYNLSPWVQRAIKHIAGPIASVELEFCEETGAGEVEVEDAALQAFWTAPARGFGYQQRLSRYDAIEATVGWLCLKGEFFWVLDDTWIAARGVRSPFLIARPDRMRPIIDDGELAGWSMTTPRGGTVDLIPSQVISSRFWNPTDDLRGSAPMAAARQAAESDYAAGRFWKALSESNGDRGETVIAPNGITLEQEAQIVRALRAKRAAARNGKFQPLFLVGDLKTEDPKIQSPDAAAVTQRLQSRHEIFIAFGVPPSFAEVTASYSIGSASDRYKLIEETCMPIAAKIAEAAEAVSSRLGTGRKVSVRFDFDDHSTMQQVRAERIEAGRKLHERGVPWSVVSDHLKLKLPPFPGWDKAWLPFSLQEVPAAAPAATVKPDVVPATEPDDTSKALDELTVLLRGGCAIHQRAGVPNPSSMSARWKRAMSVRAAHVKAIRVIVERALFEARKQTLANIAAAAARDKSIRSGAFDFIFDLVDFINMMVEPVFRADYSAYQDAGDDLIESELPDYEEPFIAADPQGLAWLQARKNYIKDTSTEMWAEVRDSLDEGIQAGESFEKLAARVRAKFNDMSKERAMRIAVTETGIAFERGRHDAMIQAAVQWKEWLSSEDEKVRDTHAKASGTVKPMDEPWMIGGMPMMHPCDPNGPIGEIVNCRCIHGPASAPPNPADIEGNDPSTQIPF